LIHVREFGHGATQDGLRPCTDLEFEGAEMLDMILIAAGFGFFVVAIAYQYACDRI
jgi:hypothetical protein